MLKWLLSLLSVAVISIGSTWYLAAHARPAQNAGTERVLQLGFYDLMSQNKEIYDSHMVTTNGTIMATITSPDDNRFVLKGKFTQVARHNGKRYYSYTPIYTSATHQALMIDGMVDLLMHMNIWLEPLTLDGQQLAVGQSGSIFLYPLI